MAMTGIAALVFDLDGTLVEFRIDYDAVRREALEALSQIEGLPEDIRSSRTGIFGILDKVSQYLEGKANSETITEDLRTRFSKIADRYELSAARTTEMIPGARDSLEEIRSQGYKMGLFTTSGREAMNHILQRFHLERYFEACVSREDAPKVKPHPLHLNRVLEILGVTPNEALVVGDSSYDAVCAKAAGVRSVGVLSGVHKLSQLQSAGADYVINRLGELPQLIHRINDEKP